MAFSITGLEALQSELNQATKALAALDGEITTIRFNPDDPASVEAAIADVEQTIDAKIAPYSGSAMVENLAADMKKQYRDQILDRVAEAHAEKREEDSVNAASIDVSILRQIENTVTDLRHADSSTFERHIQKLARILHAESLEEITKTLTQGIDIDAWMGAAGGPITGRDKLEWPVELEKEMGTTILLIDKFAATPTDALLFSRVFYRISSNNVSSTLRHMIEQVIVPFARDFINYINENRVPEVTPIVKEHAAVEKAPEVITLKPGIWGMSIDLKEAVRRLRRRFKKS